VVEVKEYTLYLCIRLSVISNGLRGVKSWGLKRGLTRLQALSMSTYGPLNNDLLYVTHQVCDVRVNRVW